MGKAFIDENTLKAIGDAIRAKTGGTDLMFPSAMAGVINGLSSSGEYLWTKQGMSENVTEASGVSYTLTTPNATRPSSEIEYSASAPVYNSEKKTWEMTNSTIETLVNTDTYVPSATNVYVRLTSAPNVWYYVSAFTAGALNAAGTCTKSMAYSTSYTAEVDSAKKYTVSNDDTAYPYTGWQDGYYWECVGAPMIDFGINNVSYQAVDGMTWGEWVDSEYNTAGATIMEGEVWVSGKLLRDGSASVTTDDVIKGSGYGYATL